MAEGIKLAPIAVVMRVAVLAFEAIARHLNGKRAARFYIVLLFRFWKIPWFIY